MTTKASVGLRNRLLEALRARLALGFLKIYSGAEPASANDAATGTLLATISVSGAGTGLSMETVATGGILAKSSQVWSGPIVATGVAGYYRFCAAGDTGAASETEERIQGSVGVAGMDLNLSSVSLTVNVAASAQTINYYVVALPTA